MMKVWSALLLLIVQLLMVEATISAESSQSNDLTDVGLAASPECSPEVISVTGLKYGAETANRMDVAYPANETTGKRPVTVLFAGEFDHDRDKAAIVGRAMCYAASHGLVVFRAHYRASVGAGTPNSSKDVAKALSWISENADLFKGNAREIIPFGLGSAAPLLMRLLLQPQEQFGGDSIAGAVLVSGTFRDGDDHVEPRALSNLRVPIVLAWSTVDGADLQEANEDLKRKMCDAGHCPRTAIIEAPGNSAALFNLDGASPGLHARVRQLIGQLDARGLP